MSSGRLFLALGTWQKHDYVMLCNVAQHYVDQCNKAVISVMGKNYYQTIDIVHQKLDVMCVCYISDIRYTAYLIFNRPIVCLKLLS